MTGVVIKLDRWVEHGFGFLRAENGQEYFVRQRDVSPSVELARGDHVTFDVVMDPARFRSAFNRPQAVNVRRAESTERRP